MKIHNADVSDDLVNQIAGMLNTTLLSFCNDDDEDMQHHYFNLRVIVEKYKELLRQLGLEDEKETA